MASTVPPGYNPETSLLQGGTAPILPVQGGGGGQPPTNDYNASVSLLQGGTGVIEPVKGGGKAVAFAKDLTSERKFVATNAPRNVVRASRVYSLEIYGIETEAPSLSLDPDLRERQRRLIKYANAEKLTPLVTSVSGISAPDGLFAYTQYPKYGDCKPQLPVNFFEVMAKKVHFMDERSHIVWVVPNVRGNKEVFESLFGKLIHDGKLPGKEHVLVFTGSFYPDTPNQTTVFLFDEIMKLKEKNPGQVYVVTPHDTILLRNGCKILEDTYAMKTTLAQKEGKSKDLPTYFEPEVLVFPHEKFLIRSTPMPISQGSKVSVGLLAQKKVASKSFYIKPDSGRKADPAPLENYVTILSDSRVPETRSWPPKTQQTIRCPKESDCQKFEIGFPLQVLGDSIQLNLLESKLYLFHITKEPIPYFTGPKEGKAKTEEAKETEEEEEGEEEEEVVLTPVRNSTELEIEKPQIPVGPYKASPDATPSATTVIPLEGFTFEVRIPSTQGVKSDWLNKKYTQGEADLINTLQITPYILQKAFDSLGSFRLANFLESLTLSKCFTETRLLLHSECVDARRFLRKVGFELQRKCLNDTMEDFGKAPEGIVLQAPVKATAPPAELLALEASLANLTLPPPLPFGLSGLERALANLKLPYPVDPELTSLQASLGNLRLPSSPSKPLVGIVNGLQNISLQRPPPALYTLVKNLNSLSIAGSGSGSGSGSDPSMVEVGPPPAPASSSSSYIPRGRAPHLVNVNESVRPLPQIADMV